MQRKTSPLSIGSIFSVIAVMNMKLDQCSGAGGEVHASKFFIQTYFAHLSYSTHTNIKQFCFVIVLICLCGRELLLCVRLLPTGYNKSLQPSAPSLTNGSSLFSEQFGPPANC